MPHHVKDFHRRDRSTVTEDDKKAISSKSELGTMLLFGTGPDSSLAESTSEGKDDNNKNGSNPAGEDVEDPMRECPPLLRRSNCRKWVPLKYIYDHEIRGECSDLPPRKKWQHTCFVVTVSMKIYRWWSRKIS